MQEGGFHQTNRVSPTRLTIVIGLHVAAVGALALTKMETPVGEIFDPIDIIDVKLPPPPPPPDPDPQPSPKVQPRSQVDTVERVIPLPSNDDFVVTQQPQDDIVFNPGPIGADDPVPQSQTLPPPPLPPAPVRMEAKLRSGDLQPPYPASEERLGNEGMVVVRVTVGPDGRVKAVEKVRATSDAFFRSTERHALRAWRFAPATEDGRPVESRKTMTLTFRLDD